MIIKKLNFKYKKESENFLRKFEFSPNTNFIYSEKNSTGKSTYMRLLLYALGFNIPNTRKVKFEDLVIELEIENQGRVFTVKRENKQIWINGTELLLPKDSLVVLSTIFDNDSLDLLENLLGAIYIDQDRGWTLLNRGIVIGNTRFYIEVFLHGLKGKDCDLETKVALRKIESELDKYRQMKIIAEYKEQTIETTDETYIVRGDIAFDTNLEKLENDRRELLIDKKSIEKRIRFLEQTIADDNKFVVWLESHNIIVRSAKGELIPVTRETIDNYIDNTELNKIEIRREKIALRKILEDIRAIDEEISTQPQFITEETIFETFDRRVSQIPISLTAIDNTIKRLSKKQSQYRETLRKSAWKQNLWATKLNDLILHYSEELGVSEYLDKGDCYLFKDIKSISGAIYHKLVFVFRICYNLILSEMLEYNVPLFIDSPNGREVEKEAIDTMFTILQRDFSDHQIFIATIFNNLFANTGNIRIDMDGTLFDFRSGQMSIFELPNVKDPLDDK